MPAHPRPATLWLLLVASLWGCWAPVDAVQILGSGSVLPFQVLQQVQFPFRFVRPATEIQYTPTSSAGGECRIMSPQSCPSGDSIAPMDIDFAGITQVFPASDYALYPDLQLYPIFAGSLVPVYNLLGWQELVLTSTAMAQIFAGEITLWDDRRITELNPNLVAKGIPPNTPIEVVMTLPGDELTELFENNVRLMYSNFTTTTPRATRMPGLMLMIAYVMQKPFTIGFSGLDVAQAFELPALRLQKGTKVVEATVLSTTYAVLELGLSFGNNGDDPAHLTTCEHRRGLADFFQWFLTSDVVAGILKGMSLAPLPSVVRDIVLARLISDLRCNDQLVWAPEPVTPVSGAGTPLLAGLLGRLDPVYHVLYPEVTVPYTPMALASEADVAVELAGHTFVATTAADRRSPANTARLLFAGVGLVAASQYRLVLDLAVLTRILNGDIVTWGHPDLRRLNPDGIVHMYSGQALGNQSILLLRGPTFDSDLFQAMMALSPVRYTGVALRSAIPFTNENVLRFSVAGIPFSLTVTVFTGDFTATTLASIRRLDGQVVAPTWRAIQACASDDAYDGTLQLSTSAVATCYPLATTVYLLVPKSRCNNATDPNRTRAVRFMEWIFSGAADGAVQEQSMAPLRNASFSIAQANAAALGLLSCDLPLAAVSSHDLPLGPILGGCLGGFLLLAAVVGLYMWKSRQELRAIRKQVSDITVAQDCAEAIARFDLETVDWLHTVHRPTPIQQAFICIINLLTEVQPFIPDQLLASLSKPKEDGCLGDGLPSADLPSALLRAESLSEGSAVRRSSDASRVTSGAAGHSPTASVATGVSYRKAGATVVTVAPHPRYSLPQAQAAVSSAAVRKAAYLFVKFGVGEHLDALDQAAAMGAACSHIIALGKAQEATVDKVTFDTVTFHWNVSSNIGTGPLRATLLATEVAKVWDAVAVPPARAPWVRVGVGYGPSVVATVSAAKQRFFVIGGPQVTMAIDLVTKDCSGKCKATVLLSNEVYKEVRYAVHCFPRLWFGPELLWEPVAVRSHLGDNEWMYQLQSLECNENDQWNGQALAEVFWLARDGTSPRSVRQAAAELRRRYGAALTSHDVASLDHLVAGLA